MLKTTTGKPASSTPITIENEFWLDTWRDEQQYGFHQTQVNPLLQRYWHTLQTPNRSRVLVPLCGKSLDMIWLMEQGFEVIGVELSQVAVKAFFVENGIKVRKQRIGNFIRWKSPKITIWCGDFFALSQQQLGHIDSIFDRGSLTALAAQHQGAYITQLLTLIELGTSSLLLTVEDIAQHTQKLMDSNLEALCEGNFSLELLHSELIASDTTPAELFTHARAYLLQATQ